MGMTDPIADMLTRIRNACHARHQEVEIPWSRIKESIAFLLEDEGYLGGIKKVHLKDRVGEVLLVQLKFDRANTPVITGPGHNRDHQTMDLLHRVDLDFREKDLFCDS